MDPLSLVGFFIIALVVFYLIQAAIHYIHFLFYALLVALLVVFFFGISYSEVIIWVGKAILWAF